MIRSCYPYANTVRYSKNAVHRIFYLVNIYCLYKSVIQSSFISPYVLFKYSLENQLEIWKYLILFDGKSIESIDQLSLYTSVFALYRRWSLSSCK